MQNNPQKNIHILGIETSCDETGVALYSSKYGLIANKIYSQISLHNEYGGVVPELASRDHIKRLTPLLDECMKDGVMPINEIDGIAYTMGPGLNGALLIGASFANALGYNLAKPVIPIHHLEGHLLSPLLDGVLDDNLEHPKIKTPFIALLVSGGHSQLIAVHKIGKYEILGDTLDDAAGEAFDKTAKMMGLNYPGGVEIAKLAQKGVDVYRLPRPMINHDTLNMSFSGLKTAVSILIKKLGGEQMLDLQTKSNIARSIEEAITDVLVEKSIRAVKKTNISRVVLCGGVSANLTLRAKFNQINNIQVFYPPLDLCTDNGGMIAIAGYMKYKTGTFDYSFKVHPRCIL